MGINKKSPVEEAQRLVKKRKERRVSITRSEYKRLLEDSAFLDALKCMGVDDWPGYGDAKQLLEDGEEDD
jgi:hypothetical protein